MIHLLQPKGNLSRRHRWALLLLVAATAALVAARMDWAPTSGFLARAASLSGLPADMADRLSYVLLVPFGALWVVFFRTTLGLNLLGVFRSILIALAFRVTGIPLGLVFLALVVGAIVAIRPILKRIRLPYTGRVSVILSAVAGIIVAATLAASWFHVDLLQRVAYFPIVALCLTGEGIAAKLDSEGMRSAMWRAAMTVLVAILITVVSTVPGFDRMLLAYPELLVLEVACIIVISEYLDLGLLSRLNPDRKPRTTDAPQPAAAAAPPGTPLRVGVVGGGDSAAEALRACGFTVERFEAAALPGALHGFLPHDPGGSGDSGGRAPDGIVLSLAGGGGRAANLAGFLEMAAAPCVGPGPLGVAASRDRAILKGLLRDAGIPAPGHALRRFADDDAAGDLRFPLLVSPRLPDVAAVARVVRDRWQLGNALAEVITGGGREALVEEVVAGRTVSLCLLGNEPVEALPALEAPPEMRPASMHEALRARLEDLAVRACRTCHGRDFARVDLLIDRWGNPYVIDVDLTPSLEAGGAFLRAAELGGYDLASLLRRLVEVAWDRSVRAPAAAAPHAPGPVPSGGVPTLAAAR